MMYGLLVRVALCGFALVVSTQTLFAQNVFSIRFDTVTASAGDTVTVNALYTFKSTHAHNINGYTAQINYDSTEVHLLGYVLAGTATPPADTGFSGTSHRGISALGQSEIDLANPVLFGIRFRVDRQLADTAFVQWDTNIPILGSTQGVDRVSYADGWVRTPTAAGHVVIQTPGETLKGITAGYFPDSIPFTLPFVVSNLDGANMTSARLTFTYDTTVLSWGQTIAGSSESLKLDSIGTTVLPGGLQQCTIVLSSTTGTIKGSDTLVKLPFVGLVGLDTVCEALTNVTLRPVNSDALIGNTAYLFDSICLEGSAPSDVAQGNGSLSLEMYPNPATDRVTINVSGNTEDANLKIYDAVGRLLFDGPLVHEEWEIPSGFRSGAYQVVLNEANHKIRIGTLIVAP